MQPTTKPKTVPPTIKPTTKPKALSDAGRAGLIASAVVGAVLLFSLYCYCRRQRRYRNSFPAFYNDIALNDPLRQELEYASESQDRHFHNANETSDDDDDAPLIGDHTVFG